MNLQEATALAEHITSAHPRLSYQMYRAEPPYDGPATPDHRNLIKVISQNTSCKQPCDTPTNNQSMTTSAFLYAHHRLVANTHASIPFFSL